MKPLHLLLPASLLLTACAITTGYRSIVLPPAFQSQARTIEVKAPIKRYNPRFFNVALGEYAVEDTDYSEAREIEVATTGNLPESTVTVDNTGWNLILSGAFIGERVTYAQYRTEHESTLSFKVAKPDGGRVTSACVVNSVGLNNVETSRLTILLKNDTEQRGSVEYYGDWLATRMICTLRDGDQTWLLRLTQRAEHAPEVDVVMGNDIADTRVLEESFVDEPYSAGPTAVLDGFAAEGTELPGVAVSTDAGLQAAVSLYGGNTAIWLGADVPAADEGLLVSASYALILHSWRTGN